MRPYHLSSVPVLPDRADIIMWADETAAGIITHRAHYEMERCTIKVPFSDKLWNELPPGISDPEWIYAFARHSCLLSLAEAYVLTRDEKYLHSFNRILSSFLRHSDRNGESWRSLEAGIRAENWLRSLELLSLVTDVKDIRDMMESSFDEHISLLLSSHRGFHRLSNWGIIQDHGLFILGLYRDDFHLIDIALNRLCEEARLQCLSDGVHWEQSPLYQAEVLHSLLDTLLQAERNRINVPDELKENTHLLAKGLSSLTGPDGNIFLQGDSDEIAADDLLTLAAYLFDDASLLSGYSMENALDGLPPCNERAERKSASLMASGNHIIRSEGISVHLFSGCMGSGHGHVAPLHIDVFLKDRAFMTDSGRFTYLDSAKRTYYRSAEAHNIPKLQGEYTHKPSGSWSFSSIGETSRGYMSERMGYELIRAENHAYAGLTVRRTVLKLDPSHFVIIDEFISEDTVKAEALFHLHPDCTIHDNAIENHGETMYISSTGALSTEECMISLHYNEESPSKLLRISGSLPHNGTMVTLLSAVPVEIETLPVVLQDSGRVLTDSEAVAFRTGKFTVLTRPAEIVNQVDVMTAGELEGYGRLIVKEDGKAPVTLLW